MVGIILGVFAMKPDVITKNFGNSIVFITCFLIFTLFLFILNLTTIFFTGLFILIIVYFWYRVNKDKSGQKYFIGALLFFLTYLISGITGNACSYVITGFESKLELPYNTFHLILGVPGQTYNYQDISCSIGNIQVKKLTKDYPDDLLAVLLYENFNYTQPYKTVFIREGEHLTLCCFRWKLVEKKSDTTIWEQYDMYDIFCGVQNWLYVKGVYRT